MWKFVTRGIRESFERRACRSNIYSQSAQDPGGNEYNHNNTVTRKQQRSPEVPVYFRCCGNAKDNGTKDKEKGHQWEARYSWTEAVGLVSLIYNYIRNQLIKIVSSFNFNRYHLRLHFPVKHSCNRLGRPSVHVLTTKTLRPAQQQQ